MNKTSEMTNIDVTVYHKHAVVRTTKKVAKTSTKM